MTKRQLRPIGLKYKHPDLCTQFGATARSSKTDYSTILPLSGHGDILGPSFPRVSRPQEVDEGGEEEEAAQGDEGDAAQLGNLVRRPQPHLDLVRHVLARLAVPVLGPQEGEDQLLLEVLDDVEGRVPPEHGVQLEPGPEGQGEAVLGKDVDVVLVLLFGRIQAGLDGGQIRRVGLVEDIVDCRE